MSDQTTVRRPDTLLADLTAGDRFHWMDERMRPGVVAQLLHVERYYDNVHGRQMVAAMVHVGGRHELLKKRADHMVLRATPADTEAAEVAARRAALVAALRELADAIEDRELPVPTYRADFTILPEAGFGPWAEYLDAEVRMHPDGFPTVKRESAVLRVSVIGDAPEGSTPGADALADGISTLLDAATGDKPAEDAEHAHVGGTIGGPGENEVECACGLVFGGFDSQASALAFMERHIANPERKPLEVDAAIAAAEALERYDSEQRAAAEPEDGHRYSCCGKVGRISRHESWCPTNEPADVFRAGA